MERAVLKDETKHNQEERSASLIRGLPDYIQIGLIGPVPADVFILVVGAMASDGRQRAEELMVKQTKNKR